MAHQINPHFLKSIESQGYVFSHLFKCSMSTRLRGDNVYQHLIKGISQYDIVNLYPKDDKIPELFKSIDKWIFPAGIRPIRQGEEKFTKIIQVMNSRDTANSSTIQDINYFTVKDKSNDKLYRCVSGIYYEKMEVNIPKDKKRSTFLIPYSYCAVSEHPFYHPLKQLVAYLILNQINSNNLIQQLQDQNSIFLDQILEDEYKVEEFVIQSVFHCSEIKAQNHKININLTNDVTHPILYYYNKNDLSQPFLNLICPSNSSFEHLIFNQSPNNLFYLVICLMMEYQVIITSNKQSTSTLFCENLIQLIRPMTWKGLYYPTHLNSDFNYQTCTQPYIVGISKKSEDGNYKAQIQYLIQYQLERFQKQPLNRVIYDLDENNFILKQDDIPTPVSYKNYLIKNLNFQIADLRFWEEQKMTIEAEMKYKQYFYNFFLLTFHDILNYFQKGNPPSLSTLTPSNQQPKAQNNDDKKLNEKQNIKSGQNNVQEIKQKQGANFISLGYAFFNQEEYIKSFGVQDQPFFQKVSQTKGFSEFVKQCFRSIDYRNDFIKEMKGIETEYSFHQIFLYVNDCRYLAKRQSKDQTLNDKILEVEQMQGQIIAHIVNRNLYPDIQLVLTHFSQDYLDGNLQFRSVQEIKTTARSQTSSENKPFIHNGKHNMKEQQAKVAEQSMNNLQQKQIQGGSFLQLSYRQGLDGEDTQRNLDKNPLYMCEISRIDQVPGQSSNNLNRLDDKQYEQILQEICVDNKDWDRISTICSYNDLDFKTPQKRNEPNTLQLFHHKQNLEKRFVQESINFNSLERSKQDSLHPKHQIAHLDPASFLGVTNITNAANNGFINNHSTSNNLEDLTTCSLRGQILKNHSQMKFSPANSQQSNNITGFHNNFLSNLDYPSTSSQQIQTSQNKSREADQKPQCLNLQQGCFEMWGHYQEEGNLYLN